MGDVNVRLNFLEKNQNLSKLKKELQEISKLASKSINININNKESKEALNLQTLRNQKVRMEGVLLDANNKKLSETKLLAKTALEEISKGNKLRADELKYITNIAKKEEWAFKNKKQANAYESAQTKKKISEEQQLLALKTKQAQLTNKSITSQYSSVPTGSAKASASVFTQGFKDYEKGVTGLSSKIASYNNLAVKTTASTASLGASTMSTTREMYSMAQAMMLLNRVVGLYKKNIQDLRSLDKVFYDLGVVGKQTVTQIEDMKNEMLDFASKMPTSAKEIASAINIIARTGRGFAEASSIVKDGIELAVASGEELSSAVEIVNKVLVGFKLNAEQAKHAMESFHSATLTTPLDLQKLNDTMKNATGAFGVFTETTSRSGEELTKYKVDLLDTAVAISGGLSLMGLQKAHLKPCDMLGYLKVA